MLIERFDVENNCVLAEVDCYGNKGIRSLRFSRRKKDFSRNEISFTVDVSKRVITNRCSAQILRLLVRRDVKFVKNQCINIIS